MSSAICVQPSTPIRPSRARASLEPASPPRSGLGPRVPISDPRRRTADHRPEADLAAGHDQTFIPLDRDEQRTDSANRCRDLRSRSGEPAAISDLQQHAPVGETTHLAHVARERVPIVGHRVPRRDRAHDPAFGDHRGPLEVRLGQVPQCLIEGVIPDDRWSDAVPRGPPARRAAPARGRRASPNRAGLPSAATTGALGAPATRAASARPRAIVLPQHEPGGPRRIPHRQRREQWHREPEPVGRAIRPGSASWLR